MVKPREESLRSPPIPIEDRLQALPSRELKQRPNQEWRMYGG